MHSLPATKAVIRRSRPAPKLFGDGESGKRCRRARMHADARLPQIVEFE